MQSRAVMRGDLTERHVRLTPQEIAVITMVRDNVENKEIAARLNLAEGTVAGYLSKLHAGLPVSNRGELGTWAAQHVEALEGFWVEESLHPPRCRCERCRNVAVAQRSDGGRPLR